MDQLTLDRSAAPTLVLNQGQKAAADSFFEFLLSEEKEMIISGPGGSGKTYLMGYLIDTILPRYFDTCRMMSIEPLYESVHMTATTNKAAEQLSEATLRETQTIQSFLGLTVRNNYSTGATSLERTKKWTVKENMVLFVDEASMVDTILKRCIGEATINCKIVYVGDHCQLGPVKETISPIYKAGLRTVYLTEPMRNAGQPALMHLCDQFRDTVETGTFYDTPLVPGVVDWMDGDQVQLEIAKLLRNGEHNHRILAFTNERVIGFNDHIRDLRAQPFEYGLGEKLINNNAVHLKSMIISVEREVEIVNIGPESTIHFDVGAGFDMKFHMCDLSTKLGHTYRDVPLPADRTYYSKLVKYFAQQKAWVSHYQLKEKFLDLRQRDASTFHKVQGSTHDTVFIDLGNLSTCHNPVQVARMLYVAVTRPRNRVIFFGQLAPKYGSIILP